MRHLAVSMVLAHAMSISLLPYTLWLINLFPSGISALIWQQINTAHYCNQ